MTREEAIKIIKALRVYECYPKSASEETKEAIDMAIEALSDRPQGEWTNEGGEPVKDKFCVYCSKCKEWSEYTTDYCPNCGADMRGDNNE